MTETTLRGRRVLVTGGTGFVGSRVVPALLAEGAEVTVLARASSRTDRLPAGVRVLRADLLTGEGVAEALAGRDALVHMAALLFGLGWRDYLAANHGAATALADALARLGPDGPSRVVLVSSLAGAGPCDRDPGRTEDEPCRPVSAYGWSKLLSESVLRAAAGDRLVVLRPPIIYGSGDRGLLPVYRGLARGIGVTPGLGRDFPVSVIHVDDVAQAVLLALGDGASGVYHLSDGRVVTMRAFYEAAAKELGRKALILPLPLWLMGITARVSTLLGSALSQVRKGGRAPNWNADKFLESSEAGWTASNARIVRELGFAPSRDLASGMRETIEGNRALGLL